MNSPGVFWASSAPPPALLEPLHAHHLLCALALLARPLPDGERLRFFLAHLPAVISRAAAPEQMTGVNYAGWDYWIRTYPYLEENAAAWHNLYWHNFT